MMFYDVTGRDRFFQKKFGNKLQTRKIFRSLFTMAGSLAGQQGSEAQESCAAPSAHTALLQRSAQQRVTTPSIAIVSAGKNRTMSLRNPSSKRGRNNFLSSPRPSARGRTGGRSSRIPPLGGFPPYIWITAGATSATLAYGYFAFLDEVPVTGRKRWIATSPEWEQQMGDREYRQLLRQFSGNPKFQVLPPTHPASRTVERVGSRIASSALEFAREQKIKHMLRTRKSKGGTSKGRQQQGQSGGDGDKNSGDWTYTVVRSETANAFVLPGNHVFVMTGLFKFVRDEDDLAAVLGHEVAHNVARHAGEKISGSFLISMLARFALLADPSGVLVTLLLPAATLFRELPNSRVQETEADQIGVYISANACYDPRAAKRVFAAMKRGEELQEHMNSVGAGGGGGGGGQQPPEWLSTHPSHESRIANFDLWLPKAMSIYETDNGYKCRKIRHDMELARRYAAATGGGPSYSYNATRPAGYGGSSAW